MAEAAADNVLEFERKPAASVVMVDPDIAERWLARNTNNRNLRRNLVESYARDMQSGDWLLTGEAVKFSADGVLVDGQHRLEAVRRSGVTVPMFVVRGLDRNTQAVLDSGAKRTVADGLAMAGYDHSTYFSSGARVAIALARGDADAYAGGVTVTNSEIRRFIDNTPDFVAGVEFSARYSRQVYTPKGVLVYVTWRLLRIDDVLTAEFLNSVATQEMLRKTDPRMVLAKRLKVIRESTSGYVALFFRAWNHWRQGHSITQLKVLRPVVIPEPK